MLTSGKQSKLILNLMEQKSAAVEGPPAMGPFLQLSTCVLFWGFLGLFVSAVEGTKPRSSSVSSQANAILSRNNVTLLALLDNFRRKVRRLVEDTGCSCPRDPFYQVRSSQAISFSL